MSTDERLFDVPPTPTEAKLSPDQRRTIRHHAAIADGRHPMMGGPVNLEHTCGDCAHHFSHTRNRTWHKCDLNATHGAGTDIRVSWPACTKWAPTEGIST